jgi:hypothetical protein
MEESAQYHVMDVDGNVVGPVSPAVLTHLVTQWRIGPDSPIRRTDGADWVTLRDVATSIGITLPVSNDWKASSEAAIAKDRSNIRWGCAVFLILGWIGMTWIGLGFLFMPMLLTGILFVVFCKVFGAMSGLDVLNVPMWTDVRVKRQPGQGLQMLALALAMGLVTAYYCWRITTQ